MAALLLHKAWKSDCVSPVPLPGSPRPRAVPAVSPGSCLGGCSRAGTSDGGTRCRMAEQRGLPSPVPPVLLQGSRGSLGSAGLPRHVPHPAIHPCGWCAAVARGQRPGIASCSAGLSHRWGYPQPPLPSRSSASPPCPLALPRFIPGVASWFVSFPVAPCFSPQWFMSSTMTPTVRAKPPCSPPDGSFIRLLLTK